MVTWGPSSIGINLQINPKDCSLVSPMAVDVETDEKDNFVGLALYDGGPNVFYFTAFTPSLKHILEHSLLITHGGKFDIAMLNKWGVKVDINNLCNDTKIQAYTLDSSEKKRGLKALAEKYLHRQRPTYKEIVGSGKKKQTLDKQPVELVAEYCSMDAIDTFELSRRLDMEMRNEQHVYYQEIELPTMKVLYKMEQKGVMVDRPYLESLKTQLTNDITALEKELMELAGQDFNPRSPKQLIPILKAQGIYLNSTDIKMLKSHGSHPFVRKLLQHREATKLLSTYVEALLQQAVDDRIYARFHQSTITGRLASNGPNLQNIPTRTDNGKKIRQAFIAKPGHILAVFDYSQIEYRLFAHLSGDPLLQEAFHNNEDFHAKMGKLAGCDRRVGKTLSFASIYGAQAKKIAYTAGVSEDEAQNLLDNYWNKLPHAAAWVTRTKYKAKQLQGVETLYKRFIPLPDIRSKNMYERLHAERQAVNFVIQGTASEPIKKAMIELDKRGLVPNIQAHDELVFELPYNDAIQDTCIVIKNVMENVVKLSVPLTVEYGIGANWKEAK
jgi:DNA polymerase-1